MSRPTENRHRPFLPSQNESHLSGSFVVAAVLTSLLTLFFVGCQTTDSEPSGSTAPAQAETESGDKAEAPAPSPQAEPSGSEDSDSQPAPERAASSSTPDGEVPGQAPTVPEPQTEESQADEVADKEEIEAERVPGSPDESPRPEAEGLSPEEEAAKDEDRLEPSESLAGQLLTPQPDLPEQAVAAAARREADPMEGAAPASPSAPSDASEPEPSIMSLARDQEWEAIHNRLQEHSPDEARELYSRLLDEVAGLPESAFSQLLPEDILTLSLLAPQPLEEEVIDTLAELVQASLGAGYRLAPAVESMTSESPALGLDLEAAQKRIGRVLLAAGEVSTASKLLPPLPELIEQGAWNRAIQLLEHARSVDAPVFDQSILRQTWTICRTQWESTSPSAAERDSLRGVIANLFPLLESADRKDWLLATLRQDRLEGGKLLGGIIRSASRLPRQDETQRLSNLALQKEALDAFMEATDRPLPSQSLLEGFSLNWVTEAERSVAEARPDEAPITFTSIDPIPTWFPEVGEEAQPLTPEALLEVGPDKDWVSQLRPSLRIRVAGGMGALNLEIDAYPRALDWLGQLALDDPAQAHQFANRLLDHWADSRDSFRQSRVRGPSPEDDRSEGSEPIPLPEAQKRRHRDSLAELWSSLSELPIPEPAPRAAWNAFEVTLAPKEPVRLNSLREVFGPLDEFSPKLATVLGSKMRASLREQWSAGPSPSISEVDRPADETAIEDGYQAVLHLLDQALENHPKHWPLHTLRGATLIDQAASRVARGEPRLKNFDPGQAWEAFKTAGQLYQNKPEPHRTPRELSHPYGEWYYSIITSQLAGVDPEAREAALTGLREALEQLPEPARKEHHHRLAEHVYETTVALPPSLKRYYIRTALELIDADGPSTPAPRLRQLARFYEELGQELTLTTDITTPGGADSRSPLGLSVILHHSRGIAQQTGNFFERLASPTSWQRPLPSTGRDYLRTRIEESLREDFTVHSIASLESGESTASTDREEWQKTWLAYAIIEPNAEAAKNIPPLTLDIHFPSPLGLVSLPVRSELTAALPGDGATQDQTPPHGLKITQGLDSRQWEETGQVTLEITAVAQGILPDHPNLIDLEPITQHWGPSDITDSGIEITGLELESETVIPTTKRQWSLDLEVPQAGPSVPSFVFPPLQADAQKVDVSYRHRHGEDWEPVDSEQALAGIELPGASRPLAFLPLVILFVLLAGGGILAGLWMRSRARGSFQADHYRMPSPVTPYTVLNLLRQINRDPKVRLNPKQQQDLQTTIQTLEENYFSENGEHSSGNGVDLEHTAQYWVDRAR